MDRWIPLRDCRRRLTLSKRKSLEDVPRWQESYGVRNLKYPVGGNGKWEYRIHEGDFERMIKRMERS